MTPRRRTSRRSRSRTLRRPGREDGRGHAEGNAPHAEVDPVARRIRRHHRIAGKPAEGRRGARDDAAPPALVSVVGEAAVRAERGDVAQADRRCHSPPVKTPFPGGGGFGGEGATHGVAASLAPTAGRDSPFDFSWPYPAFVDRHSSGNPHTAKQMPPTERPVVASRVRRRVRALSGVGRRSSSVGRGTLRGPRRVAPRRPVGGRRRAPGAARCP